MIRPRHHRGLLLCGSLCALSLPRALLAQETKPSDAQEQGEPPVERPRDDAGTPPPATIEAPPAPPAPAPYSLPWQLRPVAPATALRLDNTMAAYENSASTRGLTVVDMLTASAKLTPHVGVFARVTSAQDSPPSGAGGFVLVNPAVGGLYALSVSDVRVAFYLSATIPIGGGGGNAPNPGSLDARSAGPPARMALDSSLFAVNDFAVIPGVDVAYVAGGFTVQLEATLFQLARVRGGETQHEATKTSFATGLHVGYFFLPALSLGAELRYQRWIVPPFGANGHDLTADDPRIDQVSMAVGPRFHLPIADGTWLRPGIAYARGLDKPLGGATPNYHVVHIDVPLVF